MEGATTCLPPPTRSSSLLDEGQSWVLGVLLSNVTHCFCQGSPETTPKASSATSSGLQSWGTGGRDGNKTGKEERWWKSSSPSCSLLGALTTSADLLGHLEIWRRCVLFRRSKKREESDPLPSELGHLCRKFPGSSGLRVPLWPTSRLYVSRASWRQEVWAPADRSSGEGLWARWGHLQLAICGPGTARSQQVGGARLVCGGIHGARVDTLGVPLPREPPCTGVGPRAPAHLIFKSTDTEVIIRRKPSIHKCLISRSPIPLLFFYTDSHGAQAPDFIQIHRDDEQCQGCHGILLADPIFPSIKCISCLCVWHEGERPPLYCRGWESNLWGQRMVSVI